MVSKTKISLEEWKRENEKLQKLVDQQTADLRGKNRELEIETALERIRSRSLAMHKSDELNEVVKVLFEKMTELQVPSTAVAIQTFTEGSKDMQVFVCGDVGTGLVINQYLLPYFDHPIIHDYLDAHKKKQDFFIGSYSKEEKDSFYDVVLKRPELKDLPAEVKTMVRESEVYEITMVPAKKSLLAVNDFHGNPLSENQINILKKFTKVFDQAYIRFLDLQKAETQAREAKIETALEKVRSRSLAMHTSDELNEVVSVLFEKLKDLQIPFTAVGIAIRIEGSKDLNAFVCGNNADGLVITNYRLPYFDNPIPKDLYNALEKQLDPFVGQYSKEEKDSFYEYVLENTAEFRHLPEDIKQMIFESPTYTITHVAAKNANFNINDFEGKVLADHEVDIIKRFSRVFDQAYTRFLDLQKAEAQAREAQVNLAVERVRARALAMFKSEEILEVVYKLKEEIMGLDIPNVTAATIHLKEPYGRYRAWDLTSINEEGNELEISLDIRWHREDTHPDFFMREVWDRTEDYFVVIQGGDRYKHTVEWLHQNGHSDYAEEFEQFLETSQLEKAYHPTVPLNNGRMCIDLLDPPSPEIESILKKMAGAFDLAYRRFEDLKKSEEQLREARIETALEKVRSRTMGMQRSDELSEVANVLFAEMNELVYNLWTCGFVLCEKGREEDEWWLSLEDGFSRGFFLPNVNDYAHATLYEGWLEGDAFRTVQLDGDKLQEHYDWLMQIPVAKSIFDEMEAAGMQRPEWQKLHAAYFSKGYLVIITREPCPEEEIFKRFAKVFDQTYTRFLDLKKAEAQARESQIETALEKVRSRTMAMQHSDELIETSELMFEQIKNLGVELWSCGFSLWYDDDSYFMGYNTGPDGKMGDPLKIPLTEDVFFTTIREAKRRGNDFLVFESEGESLAQTYSYMDTLPVVGEFMRAIVKAGAELPKYQVTHCGFFSCGHLMFITQEPKPEAIDIFKRFTKVFEQTYTRFLDLQKAEEQAREAKIEMSLEKIRSRTMGMQSSDELPEVANLLFLEVQSLGIPAWSCGYCILEEDRRSSICIMSSEGTLQKPFLLPHHGEVSFEEWDDFVQGDQTFFTQELGGKAIESHYGFMKSLPQLTPIFREIEEAGLSLPTYQINHLCKFGHGFLLFITYEPVPDAHDIFKRFTRVFDQTYTRFLDLKKAEARTKESQIELSLERIRSQVTAMQESSDLFDIVVKMRSEFISLGHEADYFWHMSWLPDSYEMSMTSEDGNRIGMVIRLPKFVHEDIPGLTEWEKGNEAIYVLALGTDEAWDYIENMNTHGLYEQADPHAPTRDDIKSIGGLTFIIARTGHGEIGFSLPGEVPHPPQEALDTLVRFAGVFDLAYQRFEDLQESEQQARLILEERDRLEAALKELHATQDQLIQQEKLASLGQLTAGIAHEIKNPLNFVNNFSELSVELIEETKEELSAVSDQLSAEDKERVEEALEILNDIDMNLRKIHQHGSRADSIVKSMLEHSRGGSGKVEPTDLNALVKEFVNLSFHGMRASKDPINVDMEFDLDESIGEVSLIAEDFSRVILNICNNGFDAMREEAIINSELKIKNYSPKLKVRTMQSNTTIAVEIEDNGLGIPEDMKDKILQPFFTTKKGTQGTGLGLSITNDIVKVHGGEIEIKSFPGEGSIFTIQLPKSGL